MNSGEQPPKLSSEVAPPIAVDLFSGAGGFSEGLAQAGIRTVLAQELHPQPALTHVFNHPEAIGLVGDIRQLRPELISHLIQKHHGCSTIDLVVGGPPCQGFSTAGKKDKNDPRNTLFDNYCDIIAHLRPRALVLENVPGFKKMYGGKMYQAALSRLSDLGYVVSDRVLNAVEYGVPQRRKRFVLVGVRSDVGMDFVWPEATHSNPEARCEADLFLEPRKGFVSVEDAISDLAFLGPGMEAHRHQSPIGTPFQAERRHADLLFNHLATQHRQKAVETFKLIGEGETINSVPSGAKSAKKTMARLNRRHISNTVLALPDDLIHYHHDRIPTVREMARLQSFDDEYVFIGKRTSGFMDRKHDVPQYTQVGNAVPPLMAREIGKALVRMLGRPTRDLRNLEERRRRLSWVHGSSGYSGYTLSKAAERGLVLYDVTGSTIELPIDETPTQVQERPGMEDWRGSRHEMPKKQWAPGVSLEGSIASKRARRSPTIPDMDEKLTQSTQGS
ncbi:MAG: DNA cytosine methyltransferase [Steroidobacteraceae bacterium]|nr:DNA cytosine methyltransferase [Nevskiaceae bacterium]MCP5471076.1 DNA cytosine methyltransferase [Nevskiaceae bacterium]